MAYNEHERKISELLKRKIDIQKIEKEQLEEQRTSATIKKSISSRAQIISDKYKELLNAINI